MNWSFKRVSAQRASCRAWRLRLLHGAAVGAVVCAVAGVSVGRAAVTNGGFEKTMALAQDSSVLRAIVEKHWSLDEPCVVPARWTPNPYRANCAYRLLQDPTAAHSGNVCIFLDGDIYTGLGTVSEGQVVDASVWARGPAGVKAGIVLYSYGVDDEAKPVFLGDGLRSGWFDVTAEWTEYTAVLRIPPGVARVSFALRGQGVYFDDARASARAATEREMASLPLLPASSQQQPLRTSTRVDDSKPTPLHIGNWDFEEWVTLDQAVPLWTLADGEFPAEWTPESYKGAESTARQARSAADSGGQHALFLNGQICSAPIRAPLPSLREKLNVSVRAIGQGGHLYVGLRAYGSPDGDTEQFSFLADLIDTTTTADWRVYHGVVDLSTGPYAYYGRLQIEATDIIIDDVQVTRIPPRRAEDGRMLLTLPFASATDVPSIDGTSSPGEWYAACELTGFANIDTHALVTRQTRARIMSDGGTLFLCLQSPTRGRLLRAAVTERDGQVWTDDAVEVFVGPWPKDGDVPDVYQFIVNPKGTVFDMHRIAATGDNLKDWNCSGLRVSSKQADGVWTIELAIPLSEVGIPSGTSAEFGLQVCRDLTQPAEWSSLSGQSYRSLFLCRLQEDAPLLRWEPVGDLATGRLSLRMNVRNSASLPKVFHSRMSLTGVLERSTEQQLNLNGATESVVSLRCDDLELTDGRFDLELDDAEGKPLFRQSLLLDVQTFTDLHDAGTRGVQVEFYPIQKKVNVRLRHVGEADRHEIAAADLTLWRGDDRIWTRHVTPPLWADDEAHFTVRFADVDFVPRDGEVYRLKAVVYDADGRATQVAAGDIAVQGLPWLANGLGRDGSCIPPFEPVRVAESAISCWGRTHRIGASGWPAVIQSQSLNVLAAPIRLTAELKDGREVEARPMGSAVRFLETSAHMVTFEGESELDSLRIRVHGSLAQDGMLKYELGLTPRQPTDLKRLSLEIPLAPAKYLHCVRDRIRVNCEWIRVPPGEGVVWHSGQKANVRGIYGTFAPFVWIGVEKAGLCWFADSDRDWINTADSPCLELIRAGDHVVLRVNVVAAPGTVADPRTFVFGLQATPVRPTPVAPAHQMVMNYFGFDNPIVRAYAMGLVSKDLHLARQILEPRRQRGETAHVYMANDIMPMADPVAEYCYYEWALRSFNTYDGNLNQLSRRVNGLEPRNYIGFMNGAVKSRIDYNLSCLNTLFDASLSGLYVDNSYPKACTNIQHPGCAYIRGDGVLQGGFNLLNTRELVKRAAVLAHRRGGLRPHVSVHMTDAMVIPCFSFAGLCIDGEDRSQLSMERDFMDAWPLERVAIMGAVDWGPMRGWLPKIHFDEGLTEDRPTRTMLAELRLFDLWIWPAHCKTSILKRVYDIEEGCGIGRADTRFLGYWENTQFVRAQHPDVTVSFYVRPGEVVLMTASNFSREDVDTALEWNLAEFGFADGQVIDAESGDALPRTSAGTRLRIPWHDFRLVKVTPREQ